MKQIYLSRHGRTINLPDQSYLLISVYKIFFPPDYEITLGTPPNAKKIKMKDLELKPPPEQEKLL